MSSDRKKTSTTSSRKQATEPLQEFLVTFRDKATQEKKELRLKAEEYWECRGQAAYLATHRGWSLLAIERKK